MGDEATFQGWFMLCRARERVADRGLSDRLCSFAGARNHFALFACLWLHAHVPTRLQPHARLVALNLERWPRSHTPQMCAATSDTMCPDPVSGDFKPGFFSWLKCDVEVALMPSVAAHEARYFEV